MHPEDAYKKAVAAANAAVPSFETGTMEHERWLAVFDEALIGFVLQPQRIRCEGCSD